MSPQNPLKTSAGTSAATYLPTYPRYPKGPESAGRSCRSRDNEQHTVRSGVAGAGPATAVSARIACSEGIVATAQSEFALTFWCWPYLIILMTLSVRRAPHYLHH